MARCAAKVLQGLWPAVLQSQACGLLPWSTREPSGTGNRWCGWLSTAPPWSEHGGQCLLGPSWHAEFPRTPPVPICINCIRLQGDTSNWRKATNTQRDLLTCGPAWPALWTCINIINCKVSSPKASHTMVPKAKTSTFPLPPAKLMKAVRST
jgi:hypothetical protein